MITGNATGSGSRQKVNIVHTASLNRRVRRREFHHEYDDGYRKPWTAQVASLCTWKEQVLLLDGVESCDQSTVAALETLKSTNSSPPVTWRDNGIRLSAAVAGIQMLD